MNKEHSLEEDVLHGTKLCPFIAIHFTTGQGTAYPEGFFVQRHWHRNIEILKIVKGSYTVEIDLENYVLEEGDFCFVHSGALHQIEGNGRDSIHDVLIFNPSILEFVYEDEVQKEAVSPLLSRKRFFPRIMKPGNKVYREISRLFDQAMCIGLEKHEGWYFQEKLLLFQMLFECSLHQQMTAAKDIQSASEKERIDRYKRIISYMETHYMEKVSLSQLGEAAQCNQQYLCHFFKEIAGISPIQYLIGYRLEKAQEMLKNTTKTVLEISMDCGFENVSYFIRQFKRLNNMTPREYRQKNV